jgi:membrane protein
MADRSPPSGWIASISRVTQRVALGVYNGGFSWAGNFAYLSLLSVFAFFIVAAAAISAFGQTASGDALLAAFLQTLPPSAAQALAQPIASAMTARTGPLLWFSALVGLWTTTSLIETIRHIVHEAYGVRTQRPFWEYRLSAIAMIIAIVVLMMAALSANVLLVSVREFVTQMFPNMQTTALILRLSGSLPFLILFAALYALFHVLTPRGTQQRRLLIWPGAVAISLWWLAIITILPWVVRGAVDYELTYGSLAGVMITLIFFYLVGLGMVFGAQLNAAIAEQWDAP